MVVGVGGGVAGRGGVGGHGNMCGEHTPCTAEQSWCTEKC